MKQQRINQVFIAGGYGMIGSHVARQIRSRFPDLHIILAGRNPQRGDSLALELGHASTAALDLAVHQVAPDVAEAQLIISAVPDPDHVLGEFAIRNNIAFINITLAAGDDILPLLALSHACRPSRPVVPLGYYEAGLLLPLIDSLSKTFSEVESIAITALQDPDDPLGELTANELGSAFPPALMRKAGHWLRDDEPLDVVLVTGESVQATPFTVLDVTAAAAMTNARSVRLDVVSATSAGTRNNGRASVDLYVDMSGTDDNGKAISRRIMASDPQGQAHMTATGVITVVEAIMNSEKGGFVFPEQLMDMPGALQSMSDAGVLITYH